MQVRKEMRKIIGNKVDNFHANWKACVPLLIKLADEKKKKLKNGNVIARIFSDFDSASDDFGI